MLLFAALNGQAIAVVMAVIVATALLSWLLHRRRRNVWRRFARARGLTFAEHTQGPSVSGQIGGREIDVSTTPTSSDQGAGAVAVIRMSVSLHGVPSDMIVESTPGVIGDLTRLAEDQIHFEQDSFNRDVLVYGGNERSIRDYWNLDRQQAFLQFVHDCKCDRTVIQDATIALELRDILSNRSQLEELLNRLLCVAPQLDGNHHRS